VKTIKWVDEQCEKMYSLLQIIASLIRITVMDVMVKVKGKAIPVTGLIQDIILAFACGD
jgi:hypothetical protein